MAFVQLLIVLAGPILVAFWVRRRYGAVWSSFFWGALTFVLSQLLRIPLLLVFQTVVNPRAAEWSEPTLFWTNLVILSLTAGIFEEGARYLVLSRLAKNVRTGSEGIMYGVGHGGVEAMLIVGGAAVTAMVLLLNGDAMLAQVEEVSPEQAELLAAQIQQLRETPWWMALVAIWERAMAILFHVALSLLVLLAVKRRSFSILLGAMLIHAFYNGAALIGLRLGDVLGAEIVITLFALAPLYLLRRLRPLLPSENESAISPSV